MTDVGRSKNLAGPPITYKGFTQCDLCGFFFEIMEMIIYAIVGAVLGAGIAVYVIRSMSKKRANTFLEEAKAEAEVYKKDKVLQAKEKFLQLKEEHERTIADREKKIVDAENRVRQKENVLNQKLHEVNRQQKDLSSRNQKFNERIQAIELKEKEMEKARAEHVSKLEELAGISASKARQELVETLKEETKSEALLAIQGELDEARLNAGKEARRIVIQTIQRVATEQAIENSVSVFNIESDDVKGRIIGREGRNIRALENATGVEIIVDDTPDAIILSCFDPVRRETARLSLHQLVSDGRIHPARIEEVVRKTKRRLEEELVETGKRTCIDLNIHNLHPELVKYVGRMKYRSSYGQNLLQHSREVANLSSIMASELGLDARMAKRAGLLHDIGKVAEEETELPHAIAGMKIAERYKEHKEVLNAIGAHHDEIEMTSLISPIVQVCDALSGARPGARRQIAESYINRIRDLEALGMSYKGVSNAYAIQAGRELRVIVESDKVSDEEVNNLSLDLAQRIQKEMTYPGQVKVTVIREKRAVNVAK